MNTVQVPAVQPDESSHLTLPQSTWLSRLGINHRRSSMGFSMGTSMHEHDEENSNSFGNVFSIHKSTLGMETPAEEGAGAEVMTGSFVQVTEDGKFKLEGFHLQDQQRQVHHDNGTLSDVLGTAINVSEFPVATQESLAQLEEMKMRLNKSSNAENENVFDMDMEVEVPAINVVDHDHESPGPSRKTSREQQDSKPSSKLLSNIMQSGFAQNWFFKNDGEIDDAKPAEKFTSTAFMHDESENANFPFALAGQEDSRQKKGTKVVTTEQRKEQQEKREFRERNVFMPQNF